MANGTPSLPLSAAAARIPAYRAPSQVGQFGAFLQAMLGTRSAKREEALRQALADLERQKVEQVGEAEKQAAADRREQLDIQRTELQESRTERRQREQVEAFRRQMERSRERIGELRTQAEERESREALTRYAPGLAPGAPSATQRFLIGQETERERIQAGEAAATRAEAASERAVASARRQELQNVGAAARSTRGAVKADLDSARAERKRIEEEVLVASPQIEIPDGRGGMRKTNLIGLRVTNFARYRDEMDRFVEERSPGLSANIKRLEAEHSAAVSRIGDAEEAILREFGVTRGVDEPPPGAEPPLGGDVSGTLTPEARARTQANLDIIADELRRGSNVAENQAFMREVGPSLEAQGFVLGRSAMLAGFDRPPEPALPAPPVDTGAAAVEAFRSGAGAVPPAPEAIAPSMPPAPPSAVAPEIQALPGTPPPVSGAGPAPSMSQAAPVPTGPSSMSATALNALLVQLSQTTDLAKALRLAQQAISGGHKRDQVLNRAHPSVRTFLAQRLQNRL